MMEDFSDAVEGYLYILGVKDIDLPVSKIGRTLRNPAVRCAEINQSATGDFLWEVAHKLAVNDCRKFEALVHAKLSPLRQKRREFFNIWPDDAIRAVQSILLTTPDVREVTIAETQGEDAHVPRKNTRPRKPSGRKRSDTAYAHLLDGFTEVLGVKGRPFGQLNKTVFGISDGCEGVQWNLAIYPNDGKVLLGVNLEGIKYLDWPIAVLIKSELADPALLQLVPILRDPENITLRFARDAWQVSSRPYILEEYLGGREFRLSELTEDLWRKILTEAIGCLNNERKYLRRDRQAVTLLRKSVPAAEQTVMEVTPHLTIRTPIDPSCDVRTELSSAIERLMPIHEWASKVSGA